MKCHICGKEGEAHLCRHHTEAKEKLLAAYPLWVKAYGELGWEKYLDSVKRNVQTGQWAKEIAEFLYGG
ncbi:MAG TPA: hypothetical protein VFE91_01845 [Nitrososphaerales archaeon]|nr:hypothetical protein [Nitrososphaerales archaeon]